jgi:(1->4)-alpha-D-glucan 1-alpha-D-glucosylmutase
MAKGVEDTLFYRFNRLIALNEVGGDPSRFGLDTDEFHRDMAVAAERWPLSMSATSTHDTKRSEDVRARLAVLAERPDEWAAWMRGVWELGGRHRSGGHMDALTEYFLWQNLVGAWPIDAERLTGYALKAVREAKLHTAWVDGDPAYEQVVRRWCVGVLGDEEIRRQVDAWLARTGVETRANVLGQKVVQLLMPGVPDVYQGAELVDLSLVDPDNRRPVDYAERARGLALLDDGGMPEDLDDEKLRVVAAALRLRREREAVFVGGRAGYVEVPTSSDNLVAFRRGDGGQDDVVVLATRLAGRLADGGGWGGHTLDLPWGIWRDLLSGNTTRGGTVKIDGVLTAHGSPVAILVREKG